MTTIIMLIGMISSSFSVIFAKIGQLNPIALASYRLLLASLVLSPLFFRELKRRDSPFQLQELWPSILPGCFLGLHFITFIFGARLIPGGHSSVIITLSPVIMPFMMYFFVKEKISLIEVIGTLMTLGGVLFLGLKDFQFSKGYLKGDIICFISMIFLTLYLSFARRNKNKVSFWIYTTPLFFMGGLTCLALGLILKVPFKPQTPQDWIAIFGLAIICTVIGHSANNFGMRNLRGQLVSLINLSQIVLSTSLTFIILKEVPPTYFYPAAGIILTGPMFVIYFQNRKKAK